MGFSEIQMFAIIFLFYFIGFGLIKVLKLYIYFSLAELIGFSYLFGISSFFLQLSLYQIIGIGWIRPLLLTPWLLFIFYFLMGLKANQIHIKAFFKALSGKEMLLGIIIVAIFLYAVLEPLVRPLPSWDGWAAFYFQGKAGFLESGFSMEAAKYGGISNPPFVSNIISGLYSILGYENDRVTLLFFSFCYISLICIFIGFCSREIGRFKAFLFGILLALTPNIIRHGTRFDIGHADLTLGLFILASTILFMKYLGGKSTKVLILLQLFLGLTSLVKDEGLPFLLFVNIFLIFRFGKKIVPALSISFVFVAAWFYVKHFYNLPYNPFLYTLKIQRIPAILNYSVHEFLNIKRWQLHWLLIIFIPFFKKPTKFLPIIILFSLQLSVYLLIYVTTSWPDPIEHMRGSFDRLLLHIFPLFLLYISLTLGISKFPKNEKI